MSDLEKNSASDLLKNAFLTATVNEDSNIAVRAEDLPQGGGINFKLHFFEPQVGSSYLIKFLPNPGGEPITHRSVYKNLPDPERKGKTFHYVSSGNAKTCKALELFFELHALKKEGDAIAEKKIDKYLSRTNQGCCKIQVLQSPVAEEVGMIRMFSFATFGPNATVATLLNKKINPTKEQVQQGFEREDVFNIFGSSVMSLVCTEAVYDGVKGRDFTKSDWAPKKRGAIAKLADGKTHEFSAADLKDGALVPAVEPFFNEFVSQVVHEDYDVYNYFAYKEIDDPKNSKETNDYLINVQKKVDEIIPVIREKDLTTIAGYGKVAAPGKDGEAKPDKAKNVMAESLPDELAGSVMSAATEKPAEKKTEKPAEEKSTKTSEAAATGDEAADILNS